MSFIIERKGEIAKLTSLQTPSCVTGISPGRTVWLSLVGKKGSFGHFSSSPVGQKP